MFRRMRAWMTTASLGTVVAVSGVDCGGLSDLAAGGFEDSWGYADGSGGDYYYGFYDREGTGSFSMYPGSDVGDSLETYLGNSVVY